jgi:GAF domain-containing protein
MPMTNPHAIVNASASQLWEVQALSRLEEVRNRCAFAADDLEACLAAIVDAAIFITGADKGNLQLLDRTSGCLTIRAQRGFDQPFLDFFAFVHHKSDASCGVALLRAQRVIVEDVERSEIFSGRAAGEVLLEANVRACQSTPLTNRAGRIVGVLSTHFTHPTRLAGQQASYMDVLARRAADFIERKQTKPRLLARAT